MEFLKRFYSKPRHTIVKLTFNNEGSTDSRSLISMLLTLEVKHNEDYSSLPPIVVNANSIEEIDEHSDKIFDAIMKVEKRVVDISNFEQELEKKKEKDAIAKAEKEKKDKAITKLKKEFEKKDNEKKTYELAKKLNIEFPGDKTIEDILEKTKPKETSLFEEPKETESKVEKVEHEVKKTMSDETINAIEQDWYSKLNR